MAKYLLAYRGGSMPETEAAQAQVMAAWTGWFTQLGAAVADPGNPSTTSKTIEPGGAVTGGGPASISGYTLLSAGSLDEAVELAKGCPVLHGGASVEVIETIDVM